MAAQQSSDLASQVSPHNTTGSANDGTTLQVLLIEDNQGDALLLRKRFARNKARRFEVEHVSDLKSALKNLRMGRSPDLILLDLGLPDGQGLPVVRKVARASPLVPIIVLTAIEDERLARACVEVGATDYITKSFDSSRELSRAVDYALARTHAQALSHQLEHTDRLLALGGISAGIAHEVNNPAMLIQANLNGALNALAHDPSGNTKVCELIHESLEGIARIARVVAELSEYAGQSTNEPPIALDVCHLCRSSVHLVSYQLRHRARLVFDLNPVPVVVLPPSRLSQVIVNLAINAAHAIGAAAPRDHEVRISTRADADNVFISISDTGVGIHPDHIQNLFDPFFPTKGEGNGIGLGFSSSRDIVRGLGGEIAVCSTPGRGSTFEVRIPLQNRSGSERQPSTAKPEASRPRRKVFLVDDDAPLANAVGKALSRSHDVSVASSGAELFEKLQIESDYDVVLCDLMMPELDGVAVAERLEAEYPELRRRLILFSGGAVTPRAARFVESSRAPLLPKPSSIATIVETIERCARTNDERQQRAPS